MRATSFQLIAMAALVAGPGISGCIVNELPHVGISTATSKVAQRENLPISTTIDLGVIFIGESTQTNRWIQNQSDLPIRVAKIERSCECVNLTLSVSGLEPGQKTLAKISYDGTKEPNFIGGLQVEIQLFDENKKRIGLILVPVDVIAKTAANS